MGCLTLNEKEDVRSIASISEKNHAKQKISCPDGQLIYITTVMRSSIIGLFSQIHESSTRTGFYHFESLFQYIYLSIKRNQFLGSNDLPQM